MMDCPRCGKPHDGPHRNCETCLAKLRNAYPTSRKRTRRKALDKLGLCHECTNIAVPGTKHCAYHLERFLEIGATKRAKRKAEGRCYACGRPAAGGRNACPICLAKDRAKAERKRLARRVVAPIAA